MTDTEKQALIAHLAEKVCGWKRIEKHGVWWWETGAGDNVYPTEFDPLTDANDCSRVMAAWRKQGGELELIIAKRKIAAQAYKRDGFEHEATSDDSWTEPVCRVIASASGWEG